MSLDNMGYIIESLQGKAKYGAIEKIIEKAFSRTMTARALITGVEIFNQSHMVDVMFYVKLKPGSVKVLEDVGPKGPEYRVYADPKKAIIVPTLVTPFYWDRIEHTDKEKMKDPSNFNFSYYPNIKGTRLPFMTITSHSYVLSNRGSMDFEGTFSVYVEFDGNFFIECARTVNDSYVKKSTFEAFIRIMKYKLVYIGK